MSSSLRRLPVLMLVAGAALARVMLHLDQNGVQVGGLAAGVLYDGGSAEATTLLSVITGAMAAVLTTLFSLSLATLTFASTQFGPRLLALFLRNHRTTTLFGMLFATFGYCLAALHAIQPSDDSSFVPRFTVTIAMLLVLGTVLFIVDFGDYLARFIQAPGLIDAVSRTVNRSSAQIYPSRMGSEQPALAGNVPDTDPASGFMPNAGLVRFAGRGYVQHVNEQRLMRIAVERDLVLCLACRPGDYVLPGSVLAHVCPAVSVDHHLIRALNDQFTLGWQQTEHQNVEFPLRELVEIAVRALSPGINDPFTAMQCLDRLVDGLVSLADMNLPSAHRYDEVGELRIIVGNLPGFTSVTTGCFDMLRAYAHTSAPVVMRMLDALAQISSRTARPDAQCALRRQVLLIDESRSALVCASDQVAVHERAQRVLALIDACA